MISRISFHYHPTYMKSKQLTYLVQQRKRAPRETPEPNSAFFKYRLAYERAERIRGRLSIKFSNYRLAKRSSDDFVLKSKDNSRLSPPIRRMVCSRVSPA